MLEQIFRRKRCEHACSARIASVAYVPTSLGVISMDGSSVEFLRGANLKSKYHINLAICECTVCDSGHLYIKYS